MAGGKETPRQKMIGMMYLVLTALLALNVSKEIVNAFVKLNNTLEDKNQIVEGNIGASLQKFETLMVTKETKESTKPWYEKAKKLSDAADKVHDYLLMETNDLIKEVEKVDWLEPDPNNPKKQKLKNCMDINAKDDYDAATRLFVGDNPKSPNERGKKVRDELLKLRDEICVTMATYDEGTKNKWKFDPKAVKGDDPKSKEFEESLKAALKTVNPADQSRVGQVFKTLTYPVEAKEYDEVTSWQGSMFDHAPVVAAVALFTSLRGDVRTAQALALDHLTTKLEQPLIKINTIEPLAFAPAGYINVGDTMPLTVRIAAYDSTDKPKIQYSFGDSTMKDAKETIGNITLRGDSPGEKIVYGKIGIVQKGSLTWRPWKYKYEVGEPVGVVSNEDLTIIYAGYDHTFSASASGYAQERVTLNLPGVTVGGKGKGKFSVKAAPTMIGKAIKSTISIKGESKSFAGPTFVVKKLPAPSAFFGSIPSTESKITKAQLNANMAVGVRAGYDPSVPLDPAKVRFNVTGFEMVVTVGGNTVRKTANSGALTGEMKTLIGALKPGMSVSFGGISASGPAGPVRVTPLVFIVQ